MRKKRFAFIPTEVYISPFWRDGFVWFGWVYWEDGKAYRYQA